MSRFSFFASSRHICSATTLAVVSVLTLCCVALTDGSAILDERGISAYFVSGKPPAENTQAFHAAKTALDSKEGKAHLTIESCLLEMTNQERVKKRLKPLALSASMSELALKHSADMCAVNRLAHESELFPVGRRKFAERMKSIGLESGAENIAYHTYTADIRGLARKIVDGWMNSANHRVNILSDRFTIVGFGTLVCKDGILYVTQLFTDKPASTSTRPR